MTALPVTFSDDQASAYDSIAEMLRGAGVDIEEGVLTNVIGTQVVADACRRHGVAVMVMISTDKAVNPTNVMGATKRIAEMICQSRDIEQDAGTRYVTVRFGNVLGSSGSVVPLFQRQLAAGGCRAPPPPLLDCAW